MAASGFAWFAGNFATAGLGPLDWLDTDTAAPEIADAQGVPARWTRDEGAVQQRRADREKAAQAQQMVDAAPAMASVVAKAANPGVK